MTSRPTSNAYEILEALLVHLKHILVVYIYHKAFLGFVPSLIASMAFHSIFYAVLRHVPELVAFVTQIVRAFQIVVIS